MSQSSGGHGGGEGTLRANLDPPAQPARAPASGAEPVRAAARSPRAGARPSSWSSPSSPSWPAWSPAPATTTAAAPGPRYAAAYARGRLGRAPPRAHLRGARRVPLVRFARAHRAALATATATSVTTGKPRAPRRHLAHPGPRGHPRLRPRRRDARRPDRGRRRPARRAWRPTSSSPGCARRELGPDRAPGAAGDPPGPRRHGAGRGPRPASRTRRSPRPSPGASARRPPSASRRCGRPACPTAPTSASAASSAPSTTACAGPRAAPCWPAAACWPAAPPSRAPRSARRSSPPRGAAVAALAGRLGGVVVLRRAPGAVLASPASRSAACSPRGRRSRS